MVGGRPLDVDLVLSVTRQDAHPVRNEDEEEAGRGNWQERSCPPRIGRLGPDAEELLDDQLGQTLKAARIVFVIGNGPTLKSVGAAMWNCKASSPCPSSSYAESD